MTVSLRAGMRARLPDFLCRAGLRLPLEPVSSSP